MAIVNKIPTVDISAFIQDPTSPAGLSVVDQVRKACESTGFFLITNHGIPAKLQESVFEAARKFFQLPLEEKKRLDAKTTVGHRGYDVLESQSYEVGVMPDLKEGFYVGNDIPAADQRAISRRFFMGPNVWPTAMEATEMQTPAENYYAAVYDLSLNVLDVIAASLPWNVTELFSRFTSPDLVAAPLRLLHYPPARKTEKRQLGSSAHTDFGAITLLLQDGNPGLQVLDHATQTWLDVPAVRDAYVVNVGDMLQRWTGGRYKSSVHRVINDRPSDRYSVVFFFDGNLDCPLLPLDGKGEDAGLGEVLTVEGHMLRRMAESYGKK